MHERDILKRGGVAIIPTDTIYGIVGSALRRSTVERIYALRKRNPKKPVIILLGSASELRKFGVRTGTSANEFLRAVWPGPVSVVLPVPAAKWRYLHRGTKTLAFRVPRTPWLRGLLRSTGPLIAPSANTEGSPPAATIAEAKVYFPKGIAAYISRGRRAGKPSTLVALTGDGGTIIREGTGAARVRRALRAMVH